MLLVLARFSKPLIFPLKGEGDETMSIKKLIPIAVSLAAIAAANGQVPKIIHQLRIAQLEILKSSQSSKWGRPFFPFKHNDKN